MSRRADAHVAEIGISANTVGEISAELPGIDEKNVEVKVADDILTIKGEKQEEKEEKTKDYHLSERSFGSFQRAFQVPSGVDTDKIDAKFSKGILTVTLPKSTEAQKAPAKVRAFLDFVQEIAP